MDPQGQHRPGLHGHLPRQAGRGARFGHVAELDGIQAFEPREFLAGPDHVTVLGWERTQALPAGKVFETDWVHVFNLRDGKVTRFIGTYDTAAVAAARVLHPGPRTQPGALVATHPQLETGARRHAQSRA